MIEIAGLTKSYGATTVLEGIDLRVDDARIAAVVGPSGAGKSTLARCINLLERPTSGSIRVGGRDLAGLSGRDLQRARREIGTVFQSANLLRRLTAAQNIALPMRNAGVPEGEIRSRVGELLERVDMLHRANHHPAQLSGGQRQRIGIARSLALRPAVLLSDEATSGLDPDATRAILALLTELRDDLGVTVVVITHEMDVVRSIADQVAHLDQGRIVEQGSVADVVLRSDSALSRALLPLPPAAAVDGLRTWTLRYDSPHVSPLWLSLASSALGVDIALLSASIEDAAATTVGRLAVALPPHLDEVRVTEVLANLGLRAEPAAATVVGFVGVPPRHSEPAA